MIMIIKNKLLILGIETSCDETAAAVIEIRNSRFAVRSDVVLSQVNIHRKFGGVVPEVAARQHLENILPVVDRALSQAKVKIEKVDRIAVTRGPGLITSLMVGVETAKALSYIHGIPLVGINHLEGHILVNQLAVSSWRLAVSNFPALCLIVSGGHTELVLVKKIGKYQKIGQTLDDAAGECFDKVAKILGLGYPGGPIISTKAKNGNASKFNLPRPMLDRPDFDFSFSGLKTSVLYYIQKNGRPRGKRINDFCASVQQAIIDVLIDKTIRAAQQYKVKTVMMGGGVAANFELRKQLGERLAEDLPNTKYQIPNTKYCSDNAVMIAVAGYYSQAKKDGWQNIKVDPNWEIGEYESTRA